MCNWLVLSLATENAGWSQDPGSVWNKRFGVKMCRTSQYHEWYENSVVR